MNACPKCGAAKCGEREFMYGTMTVFACGTEHEQPPLNGLFVSAGCKLIAEIAALCDEYNQPYKIGNALAKRILAIIKGGTNGR